MRIDMNILRLGIALIVFIVCNIVLGSLDAYFKKGFDKAKLKEGVIKGFIVTLIFVAVYFVGTLIPDVVIINIDGQDVNFLMAIHIIILSGVGKYGAQVLQKLASIVSNKMVIKEKETRL